ncbi:AAA family ATPase [Tenacibaculum singaporense]|uniref:AAA family ATPase n=1 Tax=Tenacibaculum singaporense TaxID=2358479 RepID=A0A3Q8RPF8_9FLAO|nr:ATP-binding protein [Tenacibaculum singaporense]AZJ36442.1 AAA family ATPase [Tenacibaculum singaporense]
MKKNRIIFVSGIHGVGKGTICKNLAQKFNFNHLTASEVLKWDEISDLNNKKVKNISSTQDRLINNLKRIIEPNQKYLLDGHFVLLNSKNVPTKIEEGTFEGINPVSIILITCETKVILKRLKNRDNSNYDLSILKKMQEMEIEHATYISNKLKIPLIEVKNNNTKSLFRYLESL